VRAGARSPLAAVFHAIVILMAVVILAPWLAHVPMATMAGILVFTAWSLSEAPHFAHMVKVAPGGLPPAAQGRVRGHAHHDDDAPV